MLSFVQCVLHISGVHIDIRVGTERYNMRLVVLAALVAVCGAAKLDRGYLPPASSQTAGGLSGDLQTPFVRSSQNSPSNQVQGNQGLGGLPNGAYNNAFGDVVVDASAAGTRAAGPGESGLGGPRTSYGSQASKVGDAAFRQSQTAGFRNGFENFQANAEAETAQGFVPQQAQPERQQAAADRAANTVRFDSEVGPESFNYAFETDNGIAAEESGVATNGVQAQGAFSYTSDDGKSYSVTYTADENGYQPKGDHLPTPPPIPEEILKSLEKNAQDEAAGLIDDGSYDASKYNEGSDYNESDNGQYNRGQSSVGSGNGATSDIGAASFVNPSTFTQQSADAGNNENANFEQSASNNAPGQFAQPAQAQGGFRQAAAQASFGQSQKLQAQGNFAYLPPASQSSQASAGFRSQQLNQQPISNQASAGYRSQQLNQPSRSQNPFSNQKPSQSASASASFGPSQVNEPQPTSPSQYSSGSAQTQQGFQRVKSQQNFPSQGFNAQSSAKFSPVQAARPAQQAFRQPQFNLNQKDQGFAPTPTQSASAFASISGQPNQFSNNNNAPSFPTQISQGQFQQNSQFNKFSEKFVQQNQFNQLQFASSTQRPGFGFQNQDSSYYYNQPSQPFRTPTVEPQRNQPAQSFSANANAQFASFPTQPSFSQRGSGTTRYPRPPTLTPAEPTVFVQPENQAFNGVTQATASSFSANAQGRPSQARFPSQQPTQQSFSQSTPYPETPSQQYNGELYDYSKPAESLTTQKDSNSQSSEQVDAEVSPTQNIQAFASAEYQSPAAEDQGSSANVNQGFPEPQGQSGFSQPGFSQISAASVAGKGEVFGGPRQPPSFDEQTGYHY